MVAQNGRRANLDNSDLSWPALTGKREMRGSLGIGRNVACWIAEELGYVVIAMVPIAKADGAKHPYETWADAKPNKEAGIASAYRTPLEIMRARHFRLKCGVGIIAGKSGLVVIDIDSEESWAEFVAGRDVPRTMELSTHSGRHLIFSDDTGISYKTQGSQLATGVDVRGRGGLFVVYDPGQPERHFTDITEPAPLPDWLAAEMPRAGTRGRRKVNGRKPARVSADDIKKLSEEIIPPGAHNDWLRSTALSLANKGFTARDRNDWYMIASAALARSDECTDAKGNVDRERFPDADIMAYFDTAVEMVAAEQKDLRNRVIGYGTAQITQSYDEVEEKRVNWIWSRYAARGVITQIDGEKGQAKTFVIADVIARATRGLAMPGEEEAICDPMNVFLFAEDVPSMIRKRLRAAGADLKRVFFPHRDYCEAIVRAQAEKERRQHGEDDEEDSDLSLLLPHGSEIMLGMIQQANADMAIWDPITDYLDRSISTGIDADVRHALNPLARGLEDLDVAGISIRHMNKNPAAAARHRGGGSQAFQNRARVHLVTGRLVEENMEFGTFGLSMVDNNYVPRVKGTLTYDIVDSDIELDDIGNMIGKVEWRDLQEDLDADTLTRGNDGDAGAGSGKRGPKPVKAMAIKRILIEMGETRNKWDSAEAMAYIKEKLGEQGFDNVNDKTITKVRNDSLISSVSRPGAVGMNDWIWPGITAPHAHARA